MGDDPVIAASARKHGIAEDDIRHAYGHPTRVFELDEGFFMLIGPSRTAAMLEIGVVEGFDGTVIIHAMPARARFLG